MTSSLRPPSRAGSPDAVTPTAQKDALQQTSKHLRVSLAATPMVLKEPPTMAKHKSLEDFLNVEGLGLKKRSFGSRSVFGKKNNDEASVKSSKSMGNFMFSAGSKNSMNSLGSKSSHGGSMKSSNLRNSLLGDLGMLNRGSSHKRKDGLGSQSSHARLSMVGKSLGGAVNSLLNSSQHRQTPQHTALSDDEEEDELADLIPRPPSQQTMLGPIRLPTRRSGSQSSLDKLPKRSSKNRIKASSFGDLKNSNHSQRSNDSSPRHNSSWGDMKQPKLTVGGHTTRNSSWSHATQRQQAEASEKRRHEIRQALLSCLEEGDNDILAYLQGGKNDIAVG